MSNIGSKIEKLIADGFSYNTLRGLSESQVNLLYTRLVEEKIENKEEVTQTSTTSTFDTKNAADTKKLQDILGKKGVPATIDSATGKITVVSEKDMTEDIEVDVDDADAGEISQKPHQKMAPDGMDDDSDKELTEKFESKAQQKLFWAKCNNSRTEKAKKKWCKWAKEFSDKTDFSKLPEKKLEESLTKLVEKYIPESISKKNLMDLIESSTRTKEAPTKAPKEKEKEKKKPGNPFKIEPSQKPGPKGELDEGGSAAPAKAPERTKEKEKEKEKPGKKNPFKIEPAQKPGPKGRAPKWLSFDTFTKLGYNLK